MSLLENEVCCLRNSVSESGCDGWSMMESNSAFGDLLLLSDSHVSVFDQ